MKTKEEYEEVIKLLDEASNILTSKAIPKGLLKSALRY